MMSLTLDTVYYSKRYNRSITIPVILTPDGNSPFTSIFSRAWWIRDTIIDKGKWDDGTPITTVQTMFVFYDALRDEGQSILKASTTALLEWALR